MKHLPVLLLALLAGVAAHAQAPAGEAAERERLRVGRDAAEQRYADAKKACRATFAVTDCIKRATREHNTVTGELRRQERVLNDAERKRRAAEHLKSLDERNSPERAQQAEAKRLQALQDQKEREARAAEKAAKKAQDDAEHARTPPRVKTAPGAHGPQGTPRTPAAAKGNAPTPEEAAKNRAAYDARIREAEKHREEVRQKVAKRSKPPASALPVPN